MPPYKEHNGENSKVPDSSREGVYRLSFGITKKSYEKLSGTKPPHPPKNDVVETDDDFIALSILTPYLVYAWLNWVYILTSQPE